MGFSQKVKKVFSTLLFPGNPRMAMNILMLETICLPVVFLGSQENHGKCKKYQIN